MHPCPAPARTWRRRSAGDGRAERPARWRGAAARCHAAARLRLLAGGRIYDVEDAGPDLHLQPARCSMQHATCGAVGVSKGPRGGCGPCSLKDGGGSLCIRKLLITAVCRPALHADGAHPHGRCWPLASLPIRRACRQQPGMRMLTHSSHHAMLQVRPDEITLPPANNPFDAHVCAQGWRQPADRLPPSFGCEAHFRVAHAGQPDLALDSRLKRSISALL